MSRKTYLAFTCAALAIGTLASTSASAGTRPGHPQSVTNTGIGSIGFGNISINVPNFPNFPLPQPATNHLPRPLTGAVLSLPPATNHLLRPITGAVLSLPPATRFGDVNLSGIRFPHKPATLPPDPDPGTLPHDPATDMGHGPRYPGTVIVTNSYPDAQYLRGHRDYGWYGRYPTTVAPVIARPVIAAAPSCLSKEYLQQGVVMFRDTCTKEWAINKTSTQTASNAACLTKTNPQDGVVMFKDICSSEWAMNPAQPPDQAQN